MCYEGCTETKFDWKPLRQIKIYEQNALIFQSYPLDVISHFFHWSCNACVDLLKMTLKYISNWKTPGHDRLYELWFKKFTFIHDRQTPKQMPIRTSRTKIDDQRKVHTDPKGPKQRKHPKQIQTHNLPTDDGENINRINMERNLPFANKSQIVPWGSERMPQRIQMHSRGNLHRPVHPKREQYQTEKSRYGLDWLQRRFMICLR